MKRYEYDLIIALPPIFVIIVSSIAVFVKFRDRNLIWPWIAKNVFSGILKEKKKEDGTPRWFFKGIDLTFQREILSTIWFTTSMFFVGMLIGLTLMFWQLLLLEVSSNCDVDDPSKDCFEVKFWGWKEDPVNCSSAAIQNGITYVYCYKIVVNFGVASGAGYGTFKLSMLAFSLGSNVMLMIEKSNTLLVLRIISTLLVLLAGVIPLVLMTTPSGVAFLSNNLVIIFQAIITLGSSYIFLWNMPWDKLTALNAEKNNLNYSGLENPDAATDDNERSELIELRGRRTYNSFSTISRSKRLSL